MIPQYYIAVNISSPSGFLSNDIKDYWYVSQGKLTVPSIDDREDMQFANEAFDILGFSEEMKYNVRISNSSVVKKFTALCLQVFKNTACMMHMGNMTKDFVPVGKEEQAEIKDESNAEKVKSLTKHYFGYPATHFVQIDHYLAIHLG